MSLAPERTTAGSIGLRRLFTSGGVDPYDELLWERRDARLTNWLDGSVAFEQRDVEFPRSWSQNATNIVAQKYFRGTLGTPEREWSLKQAIDRIADTIADWGIADGYVDGDEAGAFRDELKYILATQRAAFNSPVWFNIGVPGVPQQASACFILAVEDEMASILNWYREEGIIFKGGSGAGVNLSRIRSSYEPLEGGGTASGPVSFMRGADASAGTIKSGGKTRRAAKMVILDADHPDIEQFVWAKAIEERKARTLSEAGFDMGLDGADAFSVQYQNANNSVRVTDEFMQAVVDDGDWDLTAVTTGEVLRTVKARDLWRQIAEAAWECADPGLQFDTTINRWHTAPNHGRITASNPCFTGDSLVHTDKGLIRFDELFSRANSGEEFQIWTHDVTSAGTPAQEMHLSTPDAFMITGKNPVHRLRFSNGAELRCTPGHRIFTLDDGWVEAQDLTPRHRVRSLDLSAPPVAADWALPVSADWEHYRATGDRDLPLDLPDVWTEEFAHYLGWLIGDGSTSGTSTVTIYGSADDRDEILPQHQDLLEAINAQRPIKTSEQPNGTVQLRLTRRPLKAYLEALGVRSVTGEHKTVPWSIEQAPTEIVAGFLRGLFDADGCAVDNPSKGSYVGLGSISVELLRGVQRLLTTFGISSRIYNVKRAGTKSFDYVRKDGCRVTYANKASYDLRITGADMHRFAATIGFSLSRKQRTLRHAIVDHDVYDVDTSIRLVERLDDGIELTYNLSEPRNHSYVVNGVVVRNCSEYFHVDNSACNLASVNLLKFLDDDGSFDVGAFVHTVEILITAQEILVGRADYPTEKIGDTTRALRQLGLGYANLGALLMALGLPYDSEEGRAWAAAVTSQMAGAAYAASARIAAKQGPFQGFAVDADAMLRVLRMHRDAAQGLRDHGVVPADLLDGGRESWDAALRDAEAHGVRNSQVVVIAPTGTIGLAMDCDTTGIEPDLALVKTKKLVGGGTMSIVNQTIPRALRRLGYTPDQVDDIVAHIDEHMSVVGAPHLAAEHLPVFACSMGDNTIHYEGHVRMMGAVQPFVSGGISKCITGESIVPTNLGLLRIGALHAGESPDSFRDEILEVASLDGSQKTAAFYYGGSREVIEAELRSGLRVTGTPNHRVLVVAGGGLQWRRLDELSVGESVAQRIGAELWADTAPTIEPTLSPSYGAQKRIVLPEVMTEELAFLLGAYTAEGHVTRSTWSVRITNADEEVVERVMDAWSSVFGVRASVDRHGSRCPTVVVSSKSIVEFLDGLAVGDRASSKRIPDLILRSPRTMVLSYLQGLALDAYTTSGRSAKWAICTDSPGLMDDVQAVLNNLGVLTSRISKYNRTYDKFYEEVYATGEHARRLIELVPFAESHKRERATRAFAEMAGRSPGTTDLVPGISPMDLYRCLPIDASTSEAAALRLEFAFLRDARTKQVTRRSVERVAAVPGVRLPDWLRTVLADRLHFSPVANIAHVGAREVFDLSVPATQAFVANGIVNHNTVNMPEDVTVQDIEGLHMLAWELGLKSVAIYRDNCKLGQPLSTSKAKAGGAGPANEPDVEIVERVVPHPVRQKMPRTRRGRTFEFRVADCKGFATIGEYDNGQPGEIFLTVSKQGSTMAGVMDAFAKSISYGLQYGVPLRAFVEAFTNMRFEPAGMTDDPDIRFASSIMDYLFRRLAIEYMTYDERAELGIFSIDERLQPTLPGVEEQVTVSQQGSDLAPDPKSPTLFEGSEASPIPTVEADSVRASDAPMCMTCGISMIRSGSCYVCTSCGSTSGCS